MPPLHRSTSSHSFPLPPTPHPHQPDRPAAKALVSLGVREYGAVALVHRVRALKHNAQLVVAGAVSDHLQPLLARLGRECEGAAARGHRFGRVKAAGARVSVWLGGGGGGRGLCRSALKHGGTGYMHRCRVPDESSEERTSFLFSFSAFPPRPVPVAVAVTFPVAVAVASVRGKAVSLRYLPSQEVK